MTQKIDPIASLVRQTLASATKQVVDERLRQLTPVDIRLPRIEKPKTNPNAASTAGTNKANSDASVRNAPSSAHRAVDTRLRPLTPVDMGLPNYAVEQTNPTRAAGEDSGALPELSARQLAAVRMLARGSTPREVAAELGITRQGLWKWRRTPAFARELRRLHEWLLISERRMSRTK